MRSAIKNKNKIVEAYQLGANTEMERLLIEEGTIRITEDGAYELFSQEAVHGSGEIAHAGDYFKVDTIEGKHYPYPNEKEWFEKNHILLSGNEYEQLNKPLSIWEATDPMCEEIQYLIDHGKLTLKPEDPEHYYNAFLWGAQESAAMDATVVFYEVKRNEKNEIVDISFNFVAKSNFTSSYTYL